VDGFASRTFQAAKDTVTLALPLPASSGTRTGPWKRAAQQRSLSVYFASTGLPPGSLAGNSTSTTG
jgi:hypothetical protein